jgi:membrane-bound ClpP family serine protease
LGKNIRIPGAARAGLALLLVGALFVGTGSYLNRGSLSLYGLIMAVMGFSIYMISSVMVRDKRKGTHNTKY